MLWLFSWWLGCADPEPTPSPATGCDAVEVCNGVDDDCDGRIDDDDPSLVAPRFLDGDGDGYGGTGVHRCAEEGTVAVGGDCDDDDPSRHPGAVERCGNGDDDCNGRIDGADPGLVAFSAPDADGDGFGDATRAHHGCPLPGEVASADDCDDGDAAVHPGAEELCDGHPDNDCDGVLDPLDLDEDGDGDGVCTDCDDTDPARSSLLEERCDGIDNDCDGLVDLDDDSANPYTCGPHCPVADVEPAEDDLDQYPINPCILDPASVALCDPATDTLRSGQRVHGITVAKEGPLRDELFLFLPPGPGGTNRRLRLWAAAVGYRTISLGWINDADITSSCAQTGDTCYEAFRYEATYGLDTSPFIEVGEVDSIMHRLEVLLSYLAVEEPHRDWGRYLDEKGQVRWGEVVVVGWSIGGGQAAFLAKYHPVKGVLLFSGPKDRIHEPDTVASTWLRTPGVTEPCRHYGIFHLLEDGVAPPNAVLRQAWEELGLPFPEAPLLTADPAHQTFAVDDEGASDYCGYHGVPAKDACLPDSYFEPYSRLYCAIAEEAACAP